MRLLEQQILASAIATNALCFGNFTLKSGRSSPYFFNSGNLLSSGRELQMVADVMAKKIALGNFNYLFGPAYKGISLAASCASSLWRDHGISIQWGYDRKEEKDYGEGGKMVGAQPSGKVVLIDDVLTSGKAIRQSIRYLLNAGATPHSLLVILDRQEPGQGTQNAREELQQTLGIEVHSLLTLETVIGWLQKNHRNEQAQALLAYQQSLRAETDLAS